MKLAIRENCLPGRTIMQRFTQAKEAGLSGIEIFAHDLEAHMMDYAEAMSETGLSIAAVHMGRRDGYLSPDMAEREGAIGYLRQIIAAAADLDAPQIVLVPALHTSTHMPDLTPYRSAMELEAEMLVWMLRVVSDLVGAFDTKLCLQTVNHYETHFLTSLRQAAYFCHEIDNHPDIRIAPDTFHMSLVEDDVVAALRTYGEFAESIYLSDSNGRLPGRGLLNFDDISLALQALAFDRWLILTTHHPRLTADDTITDLPNCLNMLKEAGIPA